MNPDRYLEDLENLVKNIWPHSDKWRLKDGKIEFSIRKAKQKIEWFSLYQSPERIEKFVRNWALMGGLNV